MNNNYLKIIMLTLCSVIIFTGCVNFNTDEQNKSVNAQQEMVDEEFITNDFDSMDKNIEFGFLESDNFNNVYHEGIYKCGLDFEPGEYFIVSIHGANALYDVVDNPNDFTYTYDRVFRKIEVKESQFVSIPLGALMISVDDIDFDNLKHYGVYLVGKDIPEGQYRINSLTDWYHGNGVDTEIMNIHGGYQISEGQPYNEPVDCGWSTDKSNYIVLKNGQYLTINNSKLEYAGN